MSGIIGFIDSGIGGLTTLCQCIKAYPNKDYIYIADTMYAPYGNKKDTFLLERATYLVDKLKRKGAVAVVFACNSCSSSTADTSTFSLPIIRVLPPIERVLNQTTGKVLLLATPITINSKFVKSFESDRLIKVENKMLAPLIEEVAPNFYKLKQYLKQFLLPFNDVQAVITGCTHYLFVADIISELLPDAKIYTSHQEVIEQMSELKLGIGYSNREIIVTGGGDIDKHFYLLNLLLNS